MADKQTPFVRFSFGVCVRQSYETNQLLGVKFDEDSVPPGRDPVEYLRERVITELNRVTLRDGGPVVERPPLVKIPGYSPALEAEAETPAQDDPAF